MTGPAEKFRFNIFFPVKYLMYVHIYSFLLLPVAHSRLFKILIFSGILSVSAAV